MTTSSAKPGSDDPSIPTLSRRGPEEAVDFESLLSDLSTNFIRMPAEDVDKEIERWLRRIVLALDVDRGTVTQFDTLDNGLYGTHEWAREGVNTFGRENLCLTLPWLASKILSNELVVLPDLPQGLPREATAEHVSLRRNPVRSHITVPLQIGGKTIGGVSFDKVLSKRGWSQQEVQRLKLVAEVFGNALERKRSFAEHRRLEAELRHISATALMGEFTAAVSHELNQPLGSMLNNAHAVRLMLAAKRLDLTEIREAVDDIIRDNSRAVETIQQLRALFKRGEVQMVLLDINDVFRDIDRIVRAEARSKRIDFRIEVGATMTTVVGDRTQITQALLNLVSNAFDSICDTEGSERTVILRTREPERGYLHVAVCDSGKGIDSEAMARLFDPFFTTKSKGMGMGLAIVRTIVEALGGRIWAAQNPDRGATFELTLPVASNRSPTKG